MIIRKTGIVVLFCLSLFYFPSPYLHADQKDEKKSQKSLIDQYLSLDHLYAEACEGYREGRSRRLEAKKKILRNSVFYFPQLMKEYNREDLADDIQYEWLFKLLEHICVEHPSLVDNLIENYPGYYDLIAACRTKRGMYYLEDELRAINPERNPILELFMNDDSSFFMTEEEVVTKKVLLVLLAVDGEHPGALETLLKEFEDGMFLISCRLMEQYEKDYIKKPFLTEEYKNVIFNRLGAELDSHIPGMVLGDKERMLALRTELLKIDITEQTSDDVDKLNLVFLWLLRFRLENGVFDTEVLDKYIEFTVYHKLDTLDVRRELGRECGASSRIAKDICKYISTHPPLRTTDRSELCMYPELNSYINFRKDMKEEDN